MTATRFGFFHKAIFRLWLRWFYFWYTI